MKALVTGGAGFIGGHVSEALVRDGHSVSVLDSFRPFYTNEIKRHNVQAARTAAAETDGTYELVDGDVRDSDTVERLVSDADIVYHHAAQAGVRESVDSPTEVNDINVRGTLNVLEAARDTTLRRVVTASSSSVYGRREYLPYDESHPTNPVSPYGVSKLAGDHYARVYGELYDVNTVVLRYFTVYGPRMRPDMAVSNFVSRCVAGEPPVVYGDGTQTRDMTYVDDVVQINRLLTDDDAADGEVLNVGSGTTVEIRELAAEIRDQIDPSLSVEHAARHDADADHTHADVSKANDLLGYEPTTPIHEGVEKFIEWYRANTDWYAELVR